MAENPPETYSFQVGKYPKKEISMEISEILRRRPKVLINRPKKSFLNSLKEWEKVFSSDVSKSLLDQIKEKLD